MYGTCTGIEIVTQPRSLEEVEPEQSRSLSVQATGTGNLQYRWCKGKEGEAVSSRIYLTIELPLRLFTTAHTYTYVCT